MTKRGRTTPKTERGLVVWPAIRALQRRAVPVVDFDDGLRELVRRLTETMDAEGGAGIAAPQIAVPLRVMLVRSPAQHAPLVFVNPEVTFDPVEVLDWEGCL